MAVCLLSPSCLEASGDLWPPCPESASRFAGSAGLLCCSPLSLSWRSLSLSLPPRSSLSLSLWRSLPRPLPFSLSSLSRLRGSSSRRDSLWRSRCLLLSASRSWLLSRSLLLLGSSRVPWRLDLSWERSLRRSDCSRRERSLLAERPRRLSRLLSRLPDLRSLLLQVSQFRSAQPPPV